MSAKVHIIEDSHLSVQTLISGYIFQGQSVKNLHRAAASRFTEMNKKAQGIPLNVIVIAVIALIVLVVLSLIFSGKIKGFGKGVDETADSFKNLCEIPGTERECVSSISDCQPDDGDVLSGTFSDCAKKGSSYLCCENI